MSKKNLTYGDVIRKARKIISEMPSPLAEVSDGDLLKKTLRVASEIVCKKTPDLKTATEFMDCIVAVIKRTSADLKKHYKLLGVIEVLDSSMYEGSTASAIYSTYHKKTSQNDKIYALAYALSESVGSRYLDEAFVNNPQLDAPQERDKIIGNYTNYRETRGNDHLAVFTP